MLFILVCRDGRDVIAKDREKFFLGDVDGRKIVDGFTVFCCKDSDPMKGLFEEVRADIPNDPDEGWDISASAPEMIFYAMKGAIDIGEMFDEAMVDVVDLPRGSLAEVIVKNHGSGRSRIGAEFVARVKEYVGDGFQRGFILGDEGITCEKRDEELDLFAVFVGVFKVLDDRLVAGSMSLAFVCPISHVGIGVTEGVNAEVFHEGEKFTSILVNRKNNHKNILVAIFIFL